MIKKSLLGATMLAAMATVASAAAQTDEAETPTVVGCPADQVRTTPRDLTADMGPVYEGILASTVDISGWREQGNFMLRLRTVTVPPKGIVPLHSHEDRPGIVHVISGDLIEHHSYCDVPITHRPGDTTPAFGPGVSHWWSNPSDEPVTAISTDVVPFENMDDTNM